MLGNLGKLCCALFAVVLGLTLASPPAATGEDANRLRGYGIRVMTFNILSSAMAPGGLDRAARAAGQVQETGRTVVSFQEVAGDQLRVLEDRLPGFHFFPRRTLGSRGSAIQIAWKQSEFRVRRSGQIYRPFMGYQRPIPFVRLQDRGTGRSFFVVAIHNSPGGYETERDISTAAEIQLISRLEAKKGKPVLVLGDVNERDEFCRKVARATDQISMGGRRNRPCPVPAHGGPDWMLGTWHGTDFSHYTKVYNQISDHPMVLAKVWVNDDGR
ncbi:MAG TPA: endonuclease/exonuclease/phosphatase family protein [Nocardioides sp.]|nr:endonuclease/exonuclease/phosphatase family protein [Nocardioides sp.]